MANSEYLQRFLQVRGLIEQNTQLFTNIGAAILQQYQGHTARTGIYVAGTGKNHKIFGLGKIIDDMYLALRLPRLDAYTLESPFLLRCELASYDDAFNRGVRTPNFVGVITWKDFVADDVIMAAILTEDISKLGKYQLTEQGCTREEIKRIHPIDKTEEKFYVDPVLIDKPGGEEYLLPENRLTLPEKYYL